MANAVALKTGTEKRHDDTDPLILEPHPHGNNILHDGSVSERIEVLSHTILKAIRHQEHHIEHMFSHSYTKTENLISSYHEVLLKKLSEQHHYTSQQSLEGSEDRREERRRAHSETRVMHNRDADMEMLELNNYDNNGSKFDINGARETQDLEGREGRSPSIRSARPPLRSFTNESEMEGVDEGIIPDLKINGAFGAIFATGTEPDLEEMHYQVEAYYKSTGVAQAIARSELFINITLAVIFLNAVYIGVDSDWNKKDKLYDADTVFVFCENAFCCYFFFEWIIRFSAFERKANCIKDGWMKFDSVLMLMMIFETWILAPLLAMMGSTNIEVPVGPLRLLRLLRLTRMARLMRSVPELVTMTKGLALASRAVCSSLMMVVCLIYAFAIVLHMLLKEDTETNEFLDMKLASDFSSVTRCMWLLLIDGTFMDNSGTVLSRLLFTPTIRCKVACIVFLAFILLSAMTVMNMLIGVICEVVSQVAQGEKDAAAIQGLKETILLNLKKYDNGTNRISKKDLMRVMNEPHSKAVLNSLNVDRLFVMELQDMLFPHADSSVSIKGVMELMLMCRGDNPATVQTLAHGLLYLSTVVQTQAHITQDLFERWAISAEKDVSLSISPGFHKSKSLVHVKLSEQHHPMLHAL